MVVEHGKEQGEALGHHVVATLQWRDEGPGAGPSGDVTEASTTGQ